MHAVLVLPLLAAALARLRWTERRRVRAVRAAIGLYPVATGAFLVWM